MQKAIKKIAGHGSITVVNLQIEELYNLKQYWIIMKKYFFLINRMGMILLCDDAINVLGKYTL